MSNHTTPVPAVLVATSEDAAPGSFTFEASEKGLFYVCPCGCGATGYLGFRGRTEPDRPSWEWDGNRTHPTLEPSIRRTLGCKWHGYLHGGVWTPTGDSGQ